MLGQCIVNVINWVSSKIKMSHQPAREKKVVKVAKQKPLAKCNLEALSHERISSSSVVLTPQAQRLHDTWMRTIEEYVFRTAQNRCAQFYGEQVTFLDMAFAYETLQMLDTMGQVADLVGRGWMLESQLGGDGGGDGESGKS